MASLVSSRGSCSAFPGLNLFRVVFYAFLANRLLLQHMQIVFQRNLGSWPWGCEPFEQHSTSVLRDHSVNAISWHSIMGDDRVLWIMSANIRHLDCVSIKFCDVLSEELCNHHGFPSSGLLPKRFRGVRRRLPVGLCRFPFLPESVHSPK